MADPILSVDGLGHAYRRGPWLFRSLSFTLPAGSSLAILGPNGRGKSTLLSILAGTLPPAEGTISRTAEVATVPAGLPAEFDYSVVDMVVMGRAKRIPLLAGPSRHDEDIALAALERFGLEAFASKPFATLSTGERQLALLARAIASDARLLLLDEPTSSLDLRNQAEVMRWLGRLRGEGLATIYTTHDPNLAGLADTVLMLFADGLHRIGPAADLLNDATLSALFGCGVRGIVDGNSEHTRTYFVLPTP